VFEPPSRYLGVETYTVTDHRGRTVEVVAVPEAPAQELLGIHLLHQGERLDHLAFRYLGDATLWWRIAELNEAMAAAALTEAREIEIPVRSG
jgi:Phage Tail Protein X